MTSTKTLRATLGAGILAAAVAAAPVAKAADTIKVGILHSLSGTMAISETTLKDVMLMLIEDQNKKGGLLGKKLEAVVVDPASNWPLFAEKARELISVQKVSAVFGCWTSVSRKSVLPVFEELNSVLFYPVQYEGEESQRNVFYTGAAPNQQAIPAVDYLMREEKVKRWVLAGTDYVYPRTTNKILEAYLKSKGVAASDIMINYTPFGHSDWQTIVSNIKKFGSAGKKTAVVSTINGDEEGLYAYWSFDEAAGNVAADRTGNGHDGAILGGAEFVNLKTVEVGQSQAYKGMILGADADGDALAYSLVDGGEPSHGTFAFDTDSNTYQYTNDGTAGEDSVTIQIDDGQQTTQQTIHFNVT